MSVFALLVCGTAVPQDVLYPDSSSPPDLEYYSRPLVPEDYGLQLAPPPAGPLSTILVNIAVSAGMVTGLGNEPSLAVDPANPDRISVTTFAGGWGATAPVWLSTDGGINWVFQQSITSPPGRTGGGPNDQTIDYGRNNLLFGTFLSCGGTNCANANIYSGSSLDQFVGANTQWFQPVPGITQPANIAVQFQGVDQPWLLINRDPFAPAQDNVYTAYDDFTNGDVRCSVALGSNGFPPNFTRDNIIGQMGAGGVNPGLRMAVDPLTGWVYAIWQRRTGGGAGGSQNIDYTINRTTDGGQTWGLNGNPTGIVVANADSVQPTPKFGTVNALLGGVDHITVDPTNGDVYAVYGSRDGAGNNRLAIRRLVSDGAANLVIGPEYFVADAPVQAAIPSVAVASNGTVGVLYMTFDGFSSVPDVTTPTLTLPIFSGRLALSYDKGQTWEHQLLNTFLSPTVDNTNPRQRILGDYHQMKAVGRYFYGCYPGGGVAFGQPAAGIDPIFVKAFAGGPLVNVNNRSLEFGTACVGQTRDLTFTVFNTGTTNLNVLSIVRTGNTDFTLLTPPVVPTSISADSHVDYTIRFTPVGAPGTRTATFRITTDDPDTPTVDVVVTGEVGASNINTVIANGGDFGDVCVGSIKDLDLSINNSGACDLIITSILSNSAEFEVPSVVTFPLTLHPGELGSVPIRFRPTSLGAKFGIITIASNDPALPNIAIPVTGNAPPPDIRVTGSTDFGDVCAGENAEKTISVCNVGSCILDVTSVAFEPACDDFIIVNNPFPATVGPGSCQEVVIRFTPTSGGPKSCTLVIRGDDPDTPVISLTVTANTPEAQIKVPTSLAFVPTVIEADGPCGSELDLAIQNMQPKCNLTITSMSISGIDADKFSLLGLPAEDAFPVSLAPGEKLGDGVLMVKFTPTELVTKRFLTAQVNVTYETDPFVDPPATETIVIPLAGEAVHTGMRLLVTKAGVPVDKIVSVQVRSQTGRQRFFLMNQPLKIVNGPAGFQESLGFNYHAEFGGISNANQRLTGNYRITVKIRNGRRVLTRSVNFNTTTCTFNPELIVNF
jgi:hypothetical protein